MYKKERERNDYAYNMRNKSLGKNSNWICWKRADFLTSSGQKKKKNDADKRQLSRDRFLRARSGWQGRDLWGGKRRTTRSCRMTPWGTQIDELRRLDMVISKSPSRSATGNHGQRVVLLRVSQQKGTYMQLIIEYDTRAITVDNASRRFLMHVKDGSTLSLSDTYCAHLWENSNIYARIRVPNLAPNARSNAAYLYAVETKSRRAIFCAILSLQSLRSWLC